MNSYPSNRAFGLRSGGRPAAILLAASATILMIASLEPISAILALVAVAAIILNLTRPQLGIYIILAFFACIEEYPVSLVEGSERWVRTPFYSRSLFLKGLYLPDLIIVLAIVSWLVYFVAVKRPFRFRNPLASAHIALLGVMIVSVFLYLLRTSFLAKPVLYNVNTLGMVMRGSAVGMIAFAQMKAFLTMLVIYYLVLNYAQDARSIKRMVIFLFVLFALTLGQGLVRLALHPMAFFRTGASLFYDFASSYLFATALVFFIVFIFMGKRSPGERWALFIGAFLCGVMVLLSLRRTVWLSTALTLAFLVLIYFPASRKIKLLFWTTCLGIVCVVGYDAWNAKKDYFKAVSERISGTGLSEDSTLYRALIYSNAGRMIVRHPLLGYGAEPLWNDFVTFRRFRQTYEGVHSLYLWVIFRFGALGLAVWLWLLAVFFRKTIPAAKAMSDPFLKATMISLIMAVLLFVLISFFVPTYAMLRFTVIGGIFMALAMQCRRLGQPGPEGGLL